MSAGRTRVGVRQLRQNLSVYLRKIADGEVFEVTDRGRPVALLSPLPEHATALQRLIAERRARPADGDVLEMGMPPGPITSELSEALREQRTERP